MDMSVVRGAVTIKKHHYTLPHGVPAAPTSTVPPRSAPDDNPHAVYLLATLPLTRCVSLSVCLPTLLFCLSVCLPAPAPRLAATEETQDTRRRQNSQVSDKRHEWTLTDEARGFRLPTSDIFFYRKYYSLHKDYTTLYIQAVCEVCRVLSLMASVDYNARVTCKFVFHLSFLIVTRSTRSRL